MPGVRNYELIRCNDGGEVRIWMDGEIEILKSSHMTVGFSAAKRRQSAPTEVETITELRSIIKGLLELGPAEGDAWAWEPLAARAKAALSPQREKP